MPPLTEERRKDLIKVVKSEGESSKISVEIFVETQMMN